MLGSFFSALFLLSPTTDSIFFPVQRDCHRVCRFRFVYGLQNRFIVGNEFHPCLEEAAVFPLHLEQQGAAMKRRLDERCFLRAFDYLTLVGILHEIELGGAGEFAAVNL